MLFMFIALLTNIANAGTATPMNTGLQPIFYNINQIDIGPARPRTDKQKISTSISRGQFYVAGE